MGRNIFGADIAGKIDRSMSRRLPRLTLTSFTPGTRTANNPSAGTNPTSTTHRGRGITIGLTSLRKDTILPESNDAILIIAESLRPRVVPKANDTITVGSVISTITDVQTDPDAATHICQVK